MFLSNYTVLLATCPLPLFLPGLVLNHFGPGKTPGTYHLLICHSRSFLFRSKLEIQEEHCNTCVCCYYILENIKVKISFSLKHRKHHYTRLQKNIHNTYIPPACDGIGVEVLLKSSELVLRSRVMARHGCLSLQAIQDN